MTPQRFRLPRARRAVPGALVVGALVGSLAVSSVAGAASAPSNPFGGHFSPPTSGSVAALSSSSMEVQNPESGQVTVSWTPTTSFTQIATVAATSVSAGDCVTVSGTSSKGKITARTVSVSQPSPTGTCTAGTGSAAGGFGGGFPGRAGSGGAPSGAGRPTGSFPGAGRRFGSFGGRSGFSFASGKVTAVASGGLTLSGFSSASLRRPTKSSKKSSTHQVTPKTTTFKVATTSSTTYSQTQSTSSSALAVGDCVTASGSTSSTGAVSATTVRITSTGGKTCTSFGFGAGGFGGAPGAGTPGAGQAD